MTSKFMVKKKKNDIFIKASSYRKEKQCQQGDKTRSGRKYFYTDTVLIQKTNTSYPGSQDRMQISGFILIQFSHFAGLRKSIHKTSSLC